MRIAWVADPSLLEVTPTGLSSIVASYRYRMLIPCAELKQRRHEVKVIAPRPDPDGFDQAIEHLRDADVVVFAKTNHLDLNKSLLEAAQQLGVATVADFCDDYFGNLDRATTAHYYTMGKRADALSASTPLLAKRITEETSRNATIVVDPYEGPRGTARWAPGKPLRALWFGHYLSFPGLQQSLPTIMAAGVPMRLVVMTMSIPGIVQWCSENRIPARDCAIEFREWSCEAMWKELRDCDVVLLPIDRSHRLNLSKGQDRVVEALWAGRFVVASPLPAYEDFKAWAWISEDLVAGLRWAVEHPAEVVERINHAQESIAIRFSPETIASAWEKLLESARRERKFSLVSRW